jgi:hypothetical protein
VRIVVLILLLSRVASADTNTFTLEGQAMMSWIGGMAGGSLHYEHRFEDGAVTGRVAAAAGEFLDGGQFGLYSVLIGYRHYWGNAFGEVEVGGFGIRHGRTTGDFDEGKQGVVWYELPDSQLTFGGTAGPIEVGVYTKLPTAGVGLQLGLHFAWW